MFHKYVWIALILILNFGKLLKIENLNNKIQII